MILYSEGLVKSKFRSETVVERHTGSRSQMETLGVREGDNFPGPIRWTSLTNPTTLETRRTSSGLVRHP